MNVLGARRARSARRFYDRALTALVAAACVNGAATVVLKPLVTVAFSALGQAVVALIGGLGVASIILIASSRTGPMWLTSPERSWNGSDLLHARARTVRFRSAAGALVLGLVTAAAAPGSAVERASWGFGAAVMVVAATVAATIGQRLDRSASVRALGMLLASAALAVALLSSTAGTPALAVLGGITLVPFLARVRPSAHEVTTLRWRPAPPLWELRRAGAVVDSIRMATVMLDRAPLAAVSDAHLPATRRRLRAPPSVRPLVRTLTSRRVVDVLPLLAVPAVVTSVWGARPGVVALLVLAYAVSRAAARPLDTWVDSPAIARTFAASSPPLGKVLATTGVTLTWTFSVVACSLAGIGQMWAMTATALACLSWARHLSGRRLGGRVGALLATPMGPIPLDLARRVVAGLDVLVAGLLVLPAMPPSSALALSFGSAVIYITSITARSRRGAHFLAERD